MQVEEMTIECVKGYLVEGGFGVIQGERWLMTEVEDGIGTFRCLNGWNKGMEMDLTDKELVNYFKVID